MLASHTHKVSRRHRSNFTPAQQRALRELLAADRLQQIGPYYGKPGLVARKIARELYKMNLATFMVGEDGVWLSITSHGRDAAAALL